MKKYLVVFLSLFIIMTLNACSLGGAGDYSDDIVNLAEEQGVSPKELEAMVDDFAQLTADKYGITKEEYLQSTEDAGKTVLEEMKIAADVMGISIKELYEYEKVSLENLSEEDKVTLKDMAEAKDSLEEFADSMTENIEDMSEGESRKVTGVPKEQCVVFVSEILSEEEDDVYYDVLFTSNKDVDELLEYYKDLLVGTSNYYVMEYPGLGGVVTGTVDGKMVNISVDGEAEPVEVSVGYFK